MIVMFSHSRAKLPRHRRDGDHDRDWRCRRREARHHRRDEDCRDGSIPRRIRDYDHDERSPRSWRYDGEAWDPRSINQEPKDKRLRHVGDLRHKIEEKENDLDDLIR